MFDAFGIDVAVKATALLGLAIAAHAVLGRRRALARSATWNACLVGLALLPVSILAFPRLAIVTPRPTPTQAERPIGFPGRTFLDAPSASFPLEPSPSTPEFERTSLPAAAIERPIGKGLDFNRVMPSIYLAVASLLAARLALSVVAVGRWVRGCPVVAEPVWLEALDRCRSRLGVARPVVLRRSDRVSVPVTVGWLCPSIILPERLEGEERLIDSVLLHELAHIRRGDYGWNLVRKLVQVLYWPHPMTWALGRIIGDVREQACDDVCIHAMGGASGYRASLVEVASAMIRRPEPSVGLAMARTTNLGRRLAWIDRSPGSKRCVMGVPGRFAIATLVVSLAGVISSIELVQASPAQISAKPESAPAVGPKPAQDAADPEAIEVSVVAKETGKPIEGATVQASMDLAHIDFKTDHEGKVRIDLSRRKLRDSLNVDVWAEGFVQQRHFFSQVDPRAPKTPAQFRVELLPGEETLGGKVTDEAGKPVAGVKVKIWGYLGSKKVKSELAYMVDATTDEKGEWRCRCFRAMTFANLYLTHPDYLADDPFQARRHGQIRPTDQPQPGDRPVSDLRDFSDVQVLVKGVEVSGRVVDDQGKAIPGAEVGWLGERSREAFHDAMPKTTTDVEGRFRFPNARPGRLTLQVKASGHAPEMKSIQATPGVEPVEIKLGPPFTIAGRVVDTTGQPIPQAFVTVDTWRNHRSLGIYLATDADGRFRWDDAPPDAVMMNATRSGFEYLSMQRVVPDSGEVTMTLRRTLSISGKILNARTNEVIDPVQVEVGTPDAMTGQIKWSGNNKVFAMQGYLQASLDAEKAVEYRVRIRAKGYETCESRPFRSGEGQVEYDFKLVPAEGLQGEVVSGVVRRPDGTPLQGAEVAVAYPMAHGQDRLPSVYVDDGKIRPGGDVVIARTDAAGLFTLTREPDPAGRYYGIVVTHPDFYGEANRAAFEAGRTITTRPWCRIDGVARVGSKVVPGAEVRLFADRLINADQPMLHISGKTTADAEGRFSFGRIFPGDNRISRVAGKRPGEIGWSNGTLVQVKPGEVAKADVGGVGRPVIARIALPDNFDPKADYLAHSEVSIEADRPRIPYPAEVLAKRDGSMTTWGNQWWASAEGHAYRGAWFSVNQAKLQPDRSIRFDDVPPGDYVLNLVFSPEEFHVMGGPSDQVCYATTRFTIPEIPGGRSDEPVDLGVLTPMPKQFPKPAAKEAPKPPASKTAPAPG